MQNPTSAHRPAGPTAAWLARLRPAGLALALGVLAGCSALPTPPARPTLYDFGPGTTSPAAADGRATLPPLALAPVSAPGLPEGNPAVLYRLAYSDAQQLRPYTLARWAQPPAQLIEQRLRDRLGQRRPVLGSGDGPAQGRDADGRRAPVLRVEVEEFSHVFGSATDSAGVLRMRATLAQPGDRGEQLLGQRVFVVNRPAASADAAGGARALAAAADQGADELGRWIEQVVQAAPQRP